MQSVNEELTTVNFELRLKVDEAGRHNDDLRNLIEAADIAVVFLDPGVRVKRFTGPGHGAPSRSGCRSRPRRRPRGRPRATPRRPMPGAGS